ncbi:MAG: DUF6057 family protein [Bacteroides sp.]|nr:DUF6057 family protein [Bacteroides sp.]MCM1085896.1 DUF6057 family protein [Bacteroides sp.]
MPRFLNKTLRLIVFIGTPLLLAAWVCCFYPWLECIENESFFCFLPSYLRSFFAVPGGFSELTARFFAQFFYCRATMVAVVVFMGALLFFAARACAFSLIPEKAGRYRRLWVLLAGMVLFVPFWLLAYRDLSGFCAATAYWLNMVAAWVVLSLYGLENGRKTPLWQSLLLLPLCILMYYLAGLASLVFLLLVSLPVSLKMIFPNLCGWTLAAWVFSIVFVCPNPVQQIEGWKVRQEDRAGLRLQRIFARTEKMADRLQWNELTELASRYFDTYPVPSENANIGERKTRELLAVNLKLALLESGKLNRQYFSYNHVAEMNLLMSGLPLTGNYNIPTMRFAWRLGLFVPMRIYANNMLNVKGLQNATLNVIIPNAIFLQRYGLASNYLYFLQHTLFYRPQAAKWQACNSADDSEKDSFFAAQRRMNTSRMQEERGTELDHWVEMMYTPNSNREMLEYHTFLQLFNKTLDSLPALARHYRRLGYTTLPDYLQEGLLILQDYDPEQGGEPQTYVDYAYSPAVLASFKRARQDYRLYKMGALSVAGVEKRQGSSYFFHYYFRQFLYR